MIRFTLRARLAAGVIGLSIAGIGAVISQTPVLASNERMFAGLSPTLRMLSAGDFWSTTGIARKHDLDAATVAELEKVVNRAERPELSLRAAKLLCDNAGHFRANENLSDADAARAVTLAFEYLESHLADPDIAKFAPARGFSHVTLSWAPQDADMAWVLIETASRAPAFNGGLNIHLDLKASKVRVVKQWGDVRPAPAK